MTTITAKPVTLDGIHLTAEQTRRVLEAHSIETSTTPEDGVYTDNHGDFWSFWQGEAYFISYQDGDAPLASSDRVRGDIRWESFQPYTKVSL